MADSIGLIGLSGLWTFGKPYRIPGWFYQDFHSKSTKILQINLFWIINTVFLRSKVINTSKIFIYKTSF